MDFTIGIVGAAILLFWFTRRKREEKDTRTFSKMKVVRIPLTTFSTRNHTTQTDEIEITPMLPPQSPMSSISSLEQFVINDEYLKHSPTININAGIGQMVQPDSP